MNNEMLKLMMAVGGNGASMETLLPLLLMDKGEGDSVVSSDGSDGADSQMLDVLLYKPWGDRTLSNYANKVKSMSEDQTARMLAAIVLDILSDSDIGGLGGVLKTSAHSVLLELFGSPMSGAYAQDTQRYASTNAPVGGTILGNARKPAKEMARDIEIAGEDKRPVVVKSNVRTKGLVVV